MSNVNRKSRRFREWIIPLYGPVEAIGGPWRLDRDQVEGRPG